MIHKLFSIRNSHLIFDLFLNKKISSLYDAKVFNTLTQNSFSIENIGKGNFKNIYLIKDIPNYLSFTLHFKDSSFKLKKILQYKGYLIKTEGFVDVNNFINSTLNKRNKKNLKAKTNKLYRNHNIRSHFFFGQIDKQDYEILFEDFYRLLETRFKKKKVHNRYLLNWDDLKASTFQKILDKKASLHVIYDDLKPIAITLNFHLSDIVFSHIQTYDVDYSKYNMGDISMVNHIEWLIHNNIAIFDLSMGHTYYKEKWSNHQYYFFHHIFYNKKSILSILFAKIITHELKLLQFLRDKNIIGNFFVFDKLLYIYKSKVVRP
ncbi:GNAT family N-acetyltransferase [Flavivirga abyssicola]|uniref:GNAT family N-acetyltransferase n=1 Tax=Flavivirga abyssicola TaxID=3063533 RepID=UPI0026E0BA56|nr:GNAT family N-acetyltransferase [Flavivirga sp. MEBiC07777]WVK12998.1 GNAT family N-acetyltransferase [Flavivirga sp. MEBiC07777]